MIRADRPERADIQDPDQAPAAGPVSPILFPAFSQFYLENAARFLQNSTKAKYRQITRAYLNPFFGDIPVSDIRENRIRSFYQYLCAERSLSASSVRLIFSLLDQIMEAAVHMQLLGSNPCSLLDLPSAQRDTRIPLPPELIRAIILKEHPCLYENLFPLMIILCLRYGEAAALCLRDLDRTNSRIHITKQLSVYSLQGRLEKQLLKLPPGRCRTIPVPARAWTYFDAELEKHPFRGDPSLVFTDTRSQYLPHLKADRRLKRIASLYGRPDAALTDLRYAGAAIMLPGLPINPAAACSILGISSYRAAKIYST